VALGTTFALSLGATISNPLALKITAAALPLHVAAGIGGWLTFAAMGVSYRLLAMFMLAPELEGTRPHMVLWLGAGALAVTILGGLGLLLANESVLPALLLGGVLSLAALGLYGADILFLYRARKRRIIELNSEMTAYALASLAAAAVLALTFAGLHRFSGQIGALIFLILFGWLTGLGLAKLYKIVAFLTWLECYGPVLGKTATPRVQDLVAEGRARKWFFLYYAATWAATAALLASSIFVFRLAAAAMLAATSAIIVQLVRTRLLSNLSGPVALPAGARRPRLLICLPESG
jgi:TM2 domain-containing membrane protein YozV